MKKHRRGPSGRRLPAIMVLTAATLLLTTGASGSTAVSAPPAEAAEAVLYKAVPAPEMVRARAAEKMKAVP